MEWIEFKQARLRKAMTQIETARAIGVSLSGYRLWESGAGSPTEENLSKFRTVMDWGKVTHTLNKETK